MKNKKITKEKSIKDVFIVFLSIVALILFGFYLIKIQKNKFLFKKLNYQIKNDYLKVTGIDDGDTIVLENGETVRYLGIDTPETHHPTIGEECGGKEATELNKKLVFGKRVRLIKDKSDKDHYGRLLRYVFTEDGYFVNYELLKQGWAQILEMSSDNLFKHTFLDAQNNAVKNKLGIWGKCFLKGGEKNE
jgi:micrococcal nuclease